MRKRRGNGALAKVAHPDRKLLLGQKGERNIQPYAPEDSFQIFSAVPMQRDARMREGGLGGGKLEGEWMGGAAELDFKMIFRERTFFKAGQMQAELLFLRVGVGSEGDIGSLPVLTSLQKVGKAVVAAGQVKAGNRGRAGHDDSSKQCDRLRVCGQEGNNSIGIQVRLKGESPFEPASSR